jgi:ATP-dependent Clp protease ATP-binding subunit ClpC
MFYFERYTEDARRVLFHARYEVVSLGRRAIGPEHILLGLAREAAAPRMEVLRRSDFSLEKLRDDIMRDAELCERLPINAEVPFTFETQQVLKHAVLEADQLHHSHIGPEHLLLSILDESRCLAATILRQGGVDADVIREQIRK